MIAWRCETLGAMKIGYARVSTHEQTLDLQLDALKQADCDQLYTDTVSGLKDHRPNWDKTFSYARAGDTIVVWRLDRIGRGHTDLLRIVEAMQQRQINLKTLTGIEVDTSTPTGKLLFRIVAAMIEYERDQMRERTLAGLAAARARGKKGGGTAGRSAKEGAGSQAVRRQDQRHRLHLPDAEDLPRHAVSLPPGRASSRRAADDSVTQRGRASVRQTSGECKRSLQLQCKLPLHVTREQWLTSRAYKPATHNAC